ncbi:MAG: tetratricopeptide repeat protein [Phycisphaerales bacterium]|nr:tetratricopeptide repeat protein [Phycisphaerales bacterium]
MTRLTWSILMCVALALPGCDDAPSPPVPPTSPTLARIDASLDAAQTYLDNGDTGTAAAILRTLIDRSPEAAEAHAMLAQVLVNAAASAPGATPASYAEAYEHAAAASRLRSGDASAARDAGSIALLAGRSAEAAAHFMEAATRDPTNPQFPLFAANVLVGLGRVDEARRLIADVIALDPDEPYGYATLGGLETDAGHHEAAIRAITTAREIDPADLALRVQEARIRRRAGEPERAIELLAGLAAADRSLSYVTAELALAYGALGDHVRAAAAWMANVRREPNSWQAAVRVGESLLASGDRIAAKGWADRAALIAPDEPEVRALRAAIESAR